VPECAWSGDTTELHILCEANIAMVVEFGLNDTSCARCESDTRIDLRSNVMRESGAAATVEPRSGHHNPAMPALIVTVALAWQSRINKQSRDAVNSASAARRVNDST